MAGTSAGAKKGWAGRGRGKGVVSGKRGSRPLLPANVANNILNKNYNTTIKILKSSVKRDPITRKTSTSITPKNKDRMARINKLDKILGQHKVKMRSLGKGAR